MNDSPGLYRRAWETGKSRKCGIHTYDLGSVEQLHPMVLKRALTRSNPVLSIEHDWGDTPITCRVSNVTDHLNEANIFILRSYIPGAGLGLFLRPTPPATGVPLVIPKDRTICLYELQPTRVPLDEIVCTDYLMEDTRQKLFFNPEVYDGANVGRFVNQGGLPEGVKKLCQSLDRKTGSRGLQSGYVNDEMDKLCNVRYTVVRKSYMNVVASRDLRSGNDCQELLGNYSISYWLRFFPEHVDHTNELCKAILWCLLSRHSAYEDRSQEFSQSIVDMYSDMDCPYRLESRLESRRKRCRGEV